VRSRLATLVVSCSQKRRGSDLNYAVTVLLTSLRGLRALSFKSLMTATQQSGGESDRTLSRG